jgi:hypothetical protein
LSARPWNGLPQRIHFPSIAISLFYKDKPPGMQIKTRMKDLLFLGKKTGKLYFRVAGETLIHVSKRLSYCYRLFRGFTLHPNTKNTMQYD